MASLVLFTIVLGIGQISSAKALGLITALVPTARFLGGSALGALVTVLALLLTLLGHSITGDLSFDRRFYDRINRIAMLSVVGIVMGVILLLFVAVPLAEFEEIAASGRLAIYYALVTVMALLGGLVVSVALLIGLTIQGVIAIGRPGVESELLEREEPVSASRPS